jgi:MFS family permease
LAAHAPTCENWDVTSLAAVRQIVRPDHPVARALTFSTTATALSKGVFFTVSALYFTRIMGLGATTVGSGLTVAGAVGVAASLAGGYLSNRWGAQRVLLAGTIGQAVALCAYVWASSPVAFVVVACVAVSQQSIQRTALSTLIAETFTGPDRVAVRARLRVLTNAFIAVGTGLGAVALISGTAGGYVAAMLATAFFLGLSALAVRRIGPILPARAPGPPRSRSTVANPLRDRTYLAVTALYGVTTMQFSLLTVGVPLWIAGFTAAPAALVSVTLVLNTAIVSLLQIRASRGTHDVAGSGRAAARAGLLLAAACLLYAAAHGTPPLLAAAILVLAATAHSFGEIYSEAGAWGLAFELADPRNTGGYQGVNQTGAALGGMLGPLVVTATAIHHGRPGWFALGLLFATAGTLTYAISRRAARGRSRS